MGFYYIKGLGTLWVGTEPPPTQRTNVFWFDITLDSSYRFTLLAYDVYTERWKPVLGAAERPEFRVNDEGILQYRFPNDPDWTDIVDLNNYSGLKTLLNPDANLIIEPGAYFCTGQKINFPSGLNGQFNSFFLFVEEKNYSYLTQTCLSEGYTYIRHLLTQTTWTEWIATNLPEATESSDFKYFKIVYDVPAIFADDTVYIEMPEASRPFTVSISAYPDDAVVTINGISFQGSATISFPEGTQISWSVSAPQYSTQNGTFILTSDVSFSVRLLPNLTIGIGEMVIEQTFIVS